MTGQLFNLASQARDLIDQYLIQFNARKTKLFDLPASQRIFLFILTRSIKTYSSIVVLCKDGYGQDVAVLLRGLLENLITARYILQNPKTANLLAQRFVAYKWIILKRSLLEQEQKIKDAPCEKRKEFSEYKNLVMKKVEEFKEKFNVTSDKALLTWSGKTARDMARGVECGLLAEYDIIFRQCSRFSHPSILGDHEYLLQDNKEIVFSSLPSAIGVKANLQKAIEYFIEFARLINEQFQLKQDSSLDCLKADLKILNEKSPLIPPDSLEPSSQAASPIRECTVVFKISN